ncbi:MAG: helix-turn-helix domain-containing protein [Bacteroidales bacterium]
MDFPETLKALRSQFGISQRELGEAINKKPSTVGGYETGEREPDFETLHKIKAYFGCDYNLLLDNQKNDMKKIRMLQPEVIDLAEALDNKVVTINRKKLTDEDIEDLKRLIKRFI